MRLPRLIAAAFIAVFFTVAARAATEIPFRYADGMIWVKATVAGQSAPLNFLLDSGAGASVLDLGAARRLGVKLGRSESVQGVDGRAAAFRVNDFGATIGSVSAPRSVLALDLSGVSAGVHQRIDGLLGADFFRGRIVQIDYAAQKIRLLERGELNLANAEVLRLARRNDAMCICISVAGQKADWMRVDTGCSAALQWVVSGGATRALRETSIGATSGNLRQIHTDVQLGSTRLEAVRAGLHTRQIFSGEAGLLGNGILSKFTVTIDAVKNQLVLAKK